MLKIYSFIRSSFIFSISSFVTVNVLFASIQLQAGNQCVELYKANSFLRAVVPFHEELAVNSDYYKRLNLEIWQELVSNLNSTHRKLDQQILTQGLNEMGVGDRRIGSIKIITKQELDLILSKPVLTSFQEKSSNEDKRIYFVDGALDSLMSNQRVQLLSKLRSHIGENAILVVSTQAHAIKKEDVAIDLKYYRQSRFMDFLEKPLYEIGIRQYGDVEVHWDDIAHAYQVRFTLTHNLPKNLNTLKLMVGDSVVLFQSHYFDREKTHHIYRQNGYKNFRVIHNLNSRIAFIFAETIARP